MAPLGIRTRGPCARGRTNELDQGVACERAGVHAVESLMARQQIELSIADGVLDCHVFEPAGGGPWPAVIFYMDAFGIRADLDVMAQRLADAGYVVAVPNLYHRSGAFPPFDPAQVAAGGAERDRFMGMIRSIDGDMVMRDTGAVLAHLDTRPTVRPGPIGTVGYCMGGGYALRAAGVRYEIELYEGAQHGFAVHNHRVYDRAASERHWERLLGLLDAELRPAAAGPA